MGRGAAGARFREARARGAAGAPVPFARASGAPHDVDRDQRVRRGLRRGAETTERHLTAVARRGPA
ncbi:hypothetical protein CCS92_10795 [Methylobacterium radiotolerans]|nr:hypothetical protein CCS92_10795 [Methylobacterium radiotolerans]